MTRAPIIAAARQRFELKTLLLIRHAKSSWADPDLPDLDRPLSRRGRRAARRMGRRLAKQQLHPDILLSSHAVRALKTARIMARRLDYPRRAIQVNPRLYACAPADLLDAVRSLDDRVHTVMLFGHNPEITTLAQRFGAGVTAMPTCGVARLTFDMESWAALGARVPVATELHCPRRGRR